MIYIHTNNIHTSEERREQARRGKREERREERGMERRREERLAMYVLVSSVSREVGSGKNTGGGGRSHAQSWAGIQHQRLLLQRVAVTASSSLSGSKSCGRATAPHRAPRPLGSNDLPLPTPSPARRLSWGAGATSTATSTISGRERGCRRRAA